MPFAYRIYDQHRPHFITCTIHQWVDVFSRKQYADIFLDSIRYCQTHKGLKVYGWVIMTNHVHLIIGSHTHPLSDIIRDFKKFTATQIVKAIAANDKESRRKWLLWLFKKDNSVWFWEEGYHGEVIESQAFFESKLQYIHQNPVRAGIVVKAEEYLYSSACDYYGNRKGLLVLSDMQRRADETSALSLLRDAASEHHEERGNPVRAGIVVKAEEYLNSSACDYYGNRKGLLVLSDMQRRADETSALSLLRDAASEHLEERSINTLLAKGTTTAGEMPTSTKIGV